MQITVNGKPAQATDSINVTVLLTELKVEPGIRLRGA